MDERAHTLYEETSATLVVASKEVGLAVNVKILNRYILLPNECTEGEEHNMWLEIKLCGKVTAGRPSDIWELDLQIRTRRTEKLRAN